MNPGDRGGVRPASSGSVGRGKRKLPPVTEGGLDEDARETGRGRRFDMALVG